MKSLKIAIVEDNDDLRDLLIRHVKQQGYAVFGADCAEALDDLLIDHHFSIIVLDLNLPSEDGLSIAMRLKAGNPNLYIIMATARNKPEDRVAGYDSGADIYLTKPFASQELLAAIKSLERRILPDSKAATSIYLDLERSALVGKNTVHLNKQETALLKGLIEATAHKLPYFRLIEITGDEVNEVSRGTLDVRISRLKKKFLEAGISESAIRSNRAEGYQLLANLKIKFN